MNAYFRLVNGPSTTEVELIPATDGGQPIDFSELATYLQLKHIGGYNVVALNNAIQSLGSDPVRVVVADQVSAPENEMCMIQLAEDKMSAIARFYPPSEYGQVMSKQEVMNELSMRSIKYGIQDQVIDDFLANRQYCTDYVLAQGLPPRHGTDARIEYFFNTNLSTTPRKNEDGSVDFFQLDTINHCAAGQLLAKLYPEDRGEYGYSIFGDKIAPRNVKHLILKYGNNISITEDKCEIHSKINGHVVLTNDKVFVSDIYEVENVGPATGNVTSEGSVVVNGNVQAGFSIKAAGSVEVRGVVEGASIEAGGDIILMRGVNGMGKAVLKSGGKIVAKYVENAILESGSCVEAECIMHSRVNAKTYVNVEGKRGFIAGGTVRATSSVRCKTLGSEMGADTVIEVGVDPVLKERYVQLQKENIELTKKLNVIQTTVKGAILKIKSGIKLPPDQVQYIQSLAQASQQLQEQIMTNDTERDELGDILEKCNDACIEVYGVAYVGTKLAFGDASMSLKSNIQYCRFRRVGAEVKAGSI